jgi:hypothetical protein
VKCFTVAGEDRIDTGVGDLLLAVETIEIPRDHEADPVTGPSRRPRSHRHPCFHSAGMPVVPAHGDVIVSEDPGDEILRSED